MPVENPSRNKYRKLPKIVFAAQSFYPLLGGAEHTAHIILKELARHGYPVEAVCMGKPESFMLDEIQVLRVSNSDDFCKAVERAQPGVLITQLSLASAVVQQAKSLGVPVMLSIPSMDPVCAAPAYVYSCNRGCKQCAHWIARKDFMESQRRAAESADVVFCCSRFLAGIIRDFYGIAADVWYPPVDFTPDYIGPSEPGARKYITMCTAMLFKGAQTFAGIASRMPDERFLIAGRGNPGSFGLDTHHNVDCWPDIKPRVFYEATKVMLIPSVGPEAFGRTAVEAMANGIPVLASRTGGLPEAVGDAGILVDDYLNPEAWVTQLDRVLKDKNAYQQYIERGFEHCRLFSLEKLFPQFESMLGKALGKVSVTDPQARGGAASELNVTGDSDRICIIWEGAQLVHHSLALVNRELCTRIMDAGHELSIIPCEPDQFSPGSDVKLQSLSSRAGAHLSRPADVHIRHRWPPDFTPPPAGHWVMIQPWEFGNIPRGWVEPMRTMVDEIWVPTRFVQESYVRSGIAADKVRVVPNGVDATRFNPRIQPLRLKTEKKFKFLFVGGTIYRKGIDILLKAYAESFQRSDDVCLVIKDVNFYRKQACSDQIRQYQARAGAPEILYIDEDMPPGILPGLYTACGCLVSPYRGEGFGLPIAEAMACGLAVIVTGYGACLDFCSDATAYLVPSKVVPLDKRLLDDLAPAGPAFLAEPDCRALAMLMRTVYEHPDAARAKGGLASQHISAHFSWDQAARSALTRLQALKNKPVRRLHAALPEVSDRQRALRQLLSDGHAAKEQGNLEAAALAFEKAAGQFPDLDEAHALLGSALMALGRAEQAVCALRRAAELAPWLSARHLQLGKALRKTKDMPGAEQAFLKARDTGPAVLQPVISLVDIYRQQGKYLEAQSVMKSAIDINNARPSVVAILAGLSLQTGDPAMIGYCLKSLEALEPNHEMIGKLRNALVQKKAP